MRRYHHEIALMERRRRLDLLFHRKDHHGPTEPVGICECEETAGLFRKRTVFGCSCHMCRRCAWEEKRKRKLLLRREGRKADENVSAEA